LLAGPAVKSQLAYYNQPPFKGAYDIGLLWRLP